MAVEDIKIEGDYPEIVRASSGIYSLDYALGGQNLLGMPLRCVYEIYGRTNAGKSSLVYYLAGKLNSEKKIELCDLEGLDRNYILSSLSQAGFKGTLHFIQGADKKGKQRPHETMMQEMVTNLRNDEVSCSVLDSVGAVVPIAENDGDIGDANMGRRAKAMAQTVRGLVQALNYVEPAKIAFIVNHVNAIIGGRGHSTPGGDSLHFMSQVRIMISTKDVITDSNKNVLAFIAEGVVEKLRYGARLKKFTFVILPNIGISPDLSAMVDCVTLGLATREATVKLGKDSIGQIGKLIEDATKGRHDKFFPFYEALENYKRDHYGIAIPEMGGKDDDEEDGNIEVTGLDEAELP